MDKTMKIKRKTRKCSLSQHCFLSTCNALAPSQVSPNEEGMDRCIHIGGVAGNWDEEHHATKVKKTFQQFRLEVIRKNCSLVWRIN